VFHHIENWASNFSNEEKLLIPVCDVCHRRIHGKGGEVFSKEELYSYKSSPKRPSIIRDKIPLGDKDYYSFFIGSNFVADGEKASLIVFPGGHSLVSIDTSSGKLLMSILAEIKNGEPVYIIEDNELQIQTEYIWDMEYSANSLKILRMMDSKKQVFIHLNLYPEVIVIREMNTMFGGKPFSILRMRKPQIRQLEKIRSEVNKLEEFYMSISDEIDKLPGETMIRNGIDYGDELKRHHKLINKKYLEDYLRFEFGKQFSWNWQYYMWVLDQVLSESPVFQSNPYETSNTLPEFSHTKDHVDQIRERYYDLFQELAEVVVDYDGLFLLGNVVM
jgi:hypothetical protein